MKAAVRDRYGPPEVVELREIDRPVPVGDQILVRVVRASVNRADIDGLRPRWAFIRLFLGLRRPRDPFLGLDVAGVVEAVGPDARRFQPGDRVFADVYGYRTGAFAEYACAREKRFVAMPEWLSFEDAASLPHAAILAIQGLRRRDGSTFPPGARVLVDGASGNVGPFAVQIAKAMGAEVTGTCRTSKMDFVRSLGADHVLDYTATDYTKRPERYDWILDVDGHHPIRSVRRALAQGGTYVTLGGSMTGLLGMLFLAPLLNRLDRSKWAGMLLWWKPFAAADVARVLELLRSGAVRPRIDRRYPLSEVVAAIKRVDDGQAVGKVLVTVSEPPGA